ncbi:MAG: cyclic nucleotide-binding domain-containing protein [Elusimicrobiota bacterium]
MSNAVDLNPKDYVSALEILKKIDFLSGVSEDELKDILFSLQKQTFEPARTILFQGEIANRLFIISKGSVSITTKSKGSKINLAELNTNNYFGEISLLTPTSATATATAGSDGAELIILTHDSMTRLSKRIPDIQSRIKQVIDLRIASKNKAKEAEETA